MKIAGKSKIFSFIVVGVFITAHFAGCTTEKNYHILSFFFDGVPDPNAKKRIENPEASSDSAIVIKKKVTTDYFVHPPYEQEKCKSCHEEGFSNALVKPLPELCYTCHENFNTKYSSVHGPVVSGNCLTCHNHHMASNDKLLERAGRQLCFYCHESDRILGSKIHENIREKNCTECHNPHGGDNKGMLQKGSCSGCHKKFEPEYSFLHGPVASGNCTACHGSHDSKIPKLLIRDSQQLCLYCHNAEQVFNTAAHKKIKKSNCTGCHNPHGGEDRFLLMSMINKGSRQRTDSMNLASPDVQPVKDSLQVKPKQ